MIAPFAVYPILYYHYGMRYESMLLIIVAWSTFVWLTVTFLTRPTDTDKLKDFYRRIHPGGAGWRIFAGMLPDVNADKGYGRLFVNYLCGCILVMMMLFGFGKIIFHNYGEGFLYIGIGLLAGAIIYRNLSRTGWKKVI